MIYFALTVVDLLIYVASMMKSEVSNNAMERNQTDTR